MPIFSTGPGTLESMRLSFATGRWSPAVYNWFNQVDMLLSAGPAPLSQGMAVTRAVSGPGGVSQGTFVQEFTNAETVIIPGAVHGFGHKFVHVQVFDESGDLLFPVRLNVHQTTFDVTLTLRPAMSGYVVVKN